MEAGIHELSAGYALDALDEAERASFEEHLESCERCQEEVRSFLDVAAALAVAVSAAAPPPSLRDRVTHAVAGEPLPVVSLDERRRRRSLAVPALGAAAAAAACVAIGLGVWAAALKGDLDFERRAAALLADPTARTVALQAGDGKLVVDGEGRAVLVLDGVAPAPAGKTYAVWIVEGGTPRPAGLFDGSEGRDVILVEGTVPAGALVAVSVERDGGADAPTTTPFAASDPL